MKTIFTLFSFFGITIFYGTFIIAQEITLTPEIDNTIFSESDSSNGSGDYLFTGKTNQGGERRALLKFNLSSLQAGNVISSAELKLYVSKTIHDEVSVSLYLLTSDWGEGLSNALGQEGMGATPSTGDATWNYAFFDTVSWMKPGGDYINEPSATIPVNQSNLYYSWTGSGVVSDVMGWLANPSENFGWIVITEAELSAKRFNSRENVNSPPQLVVHYTTTSLSENQSDNNFLLYPNPSHGTIFIRGIQANKSCQLNITEFTGSEILNESVQVSQVGIITINLSEKGIYIIRINHMMVGKVTII